MSAAAGILLGGAPRPRAAIFLRLLAAVAFSAAGARASAEDSRRSQEIVIPEIEARTVGDVPFELTAKATSGLPVTLEVLSGPAVLDGRKLRLTDATGLVIVRATQRGNSSFQPATPAERAFSVNPRPAAPKFISGPASATVDIGGIIVLSATVSGEPKPGLQWRKDGTPVEGAREHALTIPSATLADSGAYDVVASNPSGTATSPSARVAVGKRHQSISFQGATTAIAGQQIPLGADASSGLPVHFEVVSGTAVLNGSLMTAQAGAVVVRASQDGDADYEAAAPATRTFMISAAQAGSRFP